MSAITIVLVAIVALLAGMEGILDQFQLHQPLVACTLIGLVTGRLQEGILLGGSLQMMALGWANVGSSIAKDLSGGLMGKVTEGASILGMFIIGALVERWVSISFTPVVSKVTQSAGAFIDWASLPSGSEGIREALTMYNSIGATALDQVKVTTLQASLDKLIPGLAAVCLTLFGCKLLKKKVSPIVIILALFAVGIIGRVCGFM